MEDHRCRQVIGPEMRSHAQVALQAGRRICVQFFHGRLPLWVLASARRRAVMSCQALELPCLEALKQFLPA